MSALAEQFDTKGTGTIQFEGRELHARYIVPVKSGDVLELSFVASTPRPVQGVGLAAKKCQLRVAGTTAKDIALWTDTAPARVELQVVDAKSGAEVNIVNQWRDEKYGSTMYRLNNAAIEIDRQANGSVVLHCSDGWGEPDFNDLVVQIGVRPGQRH